MEIENRRMESKRADENKRVEKKAKAARRRFTRNLRAREKREKERMAAESVERSLKTFFAIRETMESAGGIVVDYSEYITSFDLLLECLLFYRLYTSKTNVVLNSLVGPTILYITSLLRNLLAETEVELSGKGSTIRCFTHISPNDSVLQSLVVCSCDLCFCGGFYVNRDAFQTHEKNCENMKKFSVGS